MGVTKEFTDPSAEEKRKSKTKITFCLVYGYVCCFSCCKSVFLFTRRVIYE